MSLGMRPSHPWAVTIRAALLAACIATPSRAQSEPAWIPLDPAAPEGAPATVWLDAASSNDQITVVEVTIPGFWSSTFVGPDGLTYRTVEIPASPGLGSPRLPTRHQIGAPALPVVPLELVVPGLASQPAITDVTEQDPVLLPFGLVAPEFVPAMDDSEGTAPQFARDEAIYQLATAWPAENGLARTPRTMLGAIPGSACLLFPAHWTPSTGELLVYRHLRFHVSHEGSPPAPMILTRERIGLAEDTFDNWGSAAGTYAPNLFQFTGDYLVIAPQAWKATLNQLIAQKLARGFKVAFRSTESVGSTCGDFRGAITSWYASTPVWRDHYCLLVGDTDVIPMCLDPDYSSQTDDLYASPDGDDLHPEVFLGRLSVNTPAELAEQVTKILAYENTPPLTGAFDKVLLVAHKEVTIAGAFEDAHEWVRNQSYSTPPTFLTAYGSNALVSNATVSNAINAGLGLVVYRGHGSPTTWGGWAFSNQSYTPSDVVALNNAPMTPVVWSLACKNQELPTEDCIGEVWMKNTTHRAVSHYGATQNSDHGQNDDLDARLFKAVWDLGLTTQSHAIMYAEDKMALYAGGSNAWLYLLLGDPDLQIRRRPQVPWEVIHAPTLGVCTSGSCQLVIQVLDDQGAPVSDLLVAAWKPAPGQAAADHSAMDADEVFDNRYTDADGMASVPAAPTTPGFLYFTVQDREGNAVLDSVEVIDVTSVPAAEGPDLRLRAQPSVTRGAGTFFSFGRVLDAPAMLAIFDLAGRPLRRLEVTAGMAGVRWDGLDANGRGARPGLYLARLVHRSLTSTARVIVTR